MPDVDAIGDVAMGAIAARAAEPGAGEGDGHTREGACLNCGCVLNGEYCHCCGQKAHVHRTLGAFWHDLSHSVLHVEGKIWRTLPMLAWKPGELTRRYIAGERANFVSPVALFLFTVFLMFAIYSLAGPTIDNGRLRSAAAGVEDAIAEERETLTDLRTEKAERLETGAGRPVEAIDRDIRETEQGIKALQRFQAIGGNGESAKVASSKTGWQALDKRLEKFSHNPQLALYKIQSNAYKFSWALIPISVPFVWLLFLHRRRYRRYGAYDHVVFVTYSITFVSIWLVLLAVTTLIPGSEWVRRAMLFIPPVHMYRQLRGAYDLGRFSAAWRTLALMMFAFLAILLFLFLLIALGIMA